MEDMKVTATGYDFRPAHAAMQRYVDGNLLSGFSSAVLVGRDLVDVKCIGWADKEAQIPLRVDHIFRVFSNTKLITSCAALLLFEEGHFQLDDPIEQFIPQLANRRVLRSDATSLDQTEPAVRPITIRHLMSHSSGLSYGLLDPGTLIFNAYNARKVVNPASTLADGRLGRPAAGLPSRNLMGVFGRHRRAGAPCRSDQRRAFRCISSVTHSGSAWHGGHRIRGVGSQSLRCLLCRGGPHRPYEAGTYSHRRRAISGGLFASLPEAERR